MCDYGNSKNFNKYICKFVFIILTTYMLFWFCQRADNYLLLEKRHPYIYECFINGSVNRWINDAVSNENYGNLLSNKKLNDCSKRLVLMDDSIGHGFTKKDAFCLSESCSENEYINLYGSIILIDGYYYFSDSIDDYNSFIYLQGIKETEEGITRTNLAGHWTTSNFFVADKDKFDYYEIILTTGYNTELARSQTYMPVLYLLNTYSENSNHTASFISKREEYERMSLQDKGILNNILKYQYYLSGYDYISIFFEDNTGCEIQFHDVPICKSGKIDEKGVVIVE